MRWLWISTVGLVVGCASEGKPQNEADPRATKSGAVPVAKPSARPAADEEQITRADIITRVDEYNTCETPEDCHAWPDSCVIGCGKTINKVHVTTLRALIDRYEAQQEAIGVRTQCRIRCAPPRGVDCDSGKCIRVPKEPGADPIAR